MKVMPMLFQTELVCALLEGCKTVTRRPAKDVSFSERAGFSFGGFSYGKGANWRETMNNIINRPAKAGCPVNVGDLIYVRETFCHQPCGNAPELTVYKSGYPQPELVSRYESVMDESDIKWTPSIHMPRHASRITLKVTDVRIERVQDITEEQAEKEGMVPARPSSLWYPYRTSFMDVWDDIYSNWTDNPYVWVIEFDVIHKNVDRVISEMKVAA